MCPQRNTVLEVIKDKDGDGARVVGQSLKNIRKKSGLTQKQLAEILGVGQARISEKIANG